jgi:hypothetical protein
MTRKLAFALTTAGLLATAGLVLAQQTGPNGGLLGGTGGHQTELVVSPTELTVYLLEEGKVIQSKGASFRAVVQQSGKTKTINLADQQGKRLAGKLDAPLEKGAIVVLTGKDSHGDQFNARYVIK